MTQRLSNPATIAGVCVDTTFENLKEQDNFQIFG